MEYYNPRLNLISEENPWKTLEKDLIVYYTLKFDGFPDDFWNNLSKDGYFILSEIPLDIIPEINCWGHAESKTILGRVHYAHIAKILLPKGTKIKYYNKLIAINPIKIKKSILVWKDHCVHEQKTFLDRWLQKIQCLDESDLN